MPFEFCSRSSIHPENTQMQLHSLVLQCLIVLICWKFGALENSDRRDIELLSQQICIEQDSHLRSSYSLIMKFILAVSMIQTNFSQSILMNIYGRNSTRLTVREFYLFFCTMECKSFFSVNDFVTIAQFHQLNQ